MEAPFWHERWAKHEIGFHMPKPHAALERYWSSLNLAAGSRVFVPLAGKSLDLVWLARAGHQVVGIELSPVAVDEFRVEHPGESAIDLRCGDFFDLTPDTLGPVDAIFDRASLVALPPAMRRSSKPMLPEVSELEAVRHFTRLSQLNFSIDTNFYPLGSCTMKYNPKACNQYAMLPEFLSRHPLAPDTQGQGFLSCMF